MKLKISRIDTRRDDVSAALQALRNQLNLEGNVVSEGGRAKTVEVFGQPLTPRQVVAKICEDVRQEGLKAVRHYSEKLDGAQAAESHFRMDTRF